MAYDKGLFDQPVVMRHMVFRTQADGGGKTFPVDSLFPLALEGVTDTASVDEGTATLLYGLVRGIAPLIVLETGTHKGRSTRAIAEALHDNATVSLMPYTFSMAVEPSRGHLWTIDQTDWGFWAGTALNNETRPFVTAIVGHTPEALTQEPLDSLRGIELAFLDGDHTREGVEQELLFVEHRRATECLVAVENARDPAWPGVAEAVAHVKDLLGYQPPVIPLPTCTGLTLLWLSNAVAGQKPAETAQG
jgi:hypothetical protein